MHVQKLDIGLTTQRMYVGSGEKKQGLQMVGEVYNYRSPYIYMRQGRELNRLNFKQREAKSAPGGIWHLDGVGAFLHVISLV